MWFHLIISIDKRWVRIWSLTQCITIVTVYNVTLVMLHTFHFRCVDPVLLILKTHLISKKLNTYFCLLPYTLPHTLLINHRNVNIYMWCSIRSGNWTIDEWKCFNIAICDLLYTIYLFIIRRKFQHAFE